ncbi:potassium channel family protein [Phytomonospora endophytica]|uniref:Voltage-gated potassium channel n=1 Tax=Phytomonospora endophytica TaxID=714109 RepID=A0A841FCG4_9ACTN|nr:potassium channel family protein [Phytomonospora endophytica]MBB6034981.1 voltage-gated potassium channel [Phytomonospora endophytica]GIG71422.1 NAD-binding protein of Kef-type K+ transporter [Phytomonospora endophytica]
MSTDHRTPVHMPSARLSPARAILIRVGAAGACLVLACFLVIIDREGYRDSADGAVSVLDAVYYATVTLSTTGYGDIVPIDDTSRLINIVVITPLRVIFLVVLVGTTVEVLTRRTRAAWREKSWSRTLRDHTVVIGYGTKGRSAIATLRASGIPADRIVVVDRRHEHIEEASADGYVAVQGDATRSSILTRAHITGACRVIVAADRDDTSVLVTLTARQSNPDATIVAAVREAENAPLLRQSGADAVITSSDASGRLLGMSTVTPAISEVIEDLLTQGRGLDLAERPVAAGEIGKGPRELADVVVAVCRNGRRLHCDLTGPLREGDRLVTITAPATVSG